MKKVVSILLAVVMLLSITVPFAASAEFPQSGSCGTNVNYSFEPETGVLSIYGTGEMKNYGSFDSPFLASEDIRTVEVAPGVTSIGYGAFYGCSNLGILVMSTTVTTIRELAFDGCTMLHDVYYFGSPTQWNAVSIESNNLNKLASVYKNYGTGTCGTNATYAIDESTMTLTISGTGAIADYAYPSFPPYFVFKDYIHSIVIDDGITRIGNTAFASFERAEYVTIPDSVTSIGESAFAFCRSVEHFALSVSLETIANEAFYCCNWLKSVDIPASVTSIGERVFMFSDRLTTINYAGTAEQWEAIAKGEENEVLNSALKVCSDESFGGVFSGSCGTNVNYSLDVKTGFLRIYGTGDITDYTAYKSIFYGREDIQTISVDEGVTGLGAWTFQNCTGLTQADLPKTLTAIGTRVFSGCTKLEDIRIPASLQTLGNYAFSGCTALTNISFSEGLSEVSAGAFSGCTALKTVFFGEGPTAFRDYAFSGCTALEKIDLPKSVTTIIYTAFNNTNDSFSVLSPCTNFTMVEKLTKDTNRTWQKVHNYAPFSVTAPTCTEKGYTTYLCSDCHAHYDSLFVEEIPHTPGAATYENEKPATCTEAGSAEEVVKCTVCGTEISRKTITLEPTGHSFFNTKVVNPTSVKAGYIDQKCSVCGTTRRVCTAPTGKVKTVKCKARTAAAETILWSAVKGAQGYQIQISTKDGKAWDKTINAKTKTSYTFKKLAAGGTYKFRVRIYAKGVDGKWTYGAWTKAITSPTLPSGTSLTKVAGGSKSFTAQWKQNKNVNGYQVQYSLKSNFSGAKTVTIKSNKTLKTTVKKLNAKKVYYVRIRTYKTISGANYFSAWSKAVKVKTK